MTFPRIAGLLIALALALLALPGAAGAADLDWGPATLVDHSGSTPVQAYGCATATQCTAVDGAGYAVTFDPTAPGTEHRGRLGATLGTGPTIVTLLCPTTTTCVAAAYGLPSGTPNLIVFNPQDPSSASAVAIGGGLDAYALACPSATQCTGPEGGAVVTFDPHVSGTPTPIVLDAGANVDGVACPTTTQCTATGNDGKVWTFDPQTLSSPPPLTGDFGLGTNYRLQAPTCPTTSQCTAVDETHRMFTFDPHAPGHPAPTSIDSDNVACVSATRCAFGGNSGDVVTFDPNNYAGGHVATAVEPGSYVSVTCTTTSTRCLVTVDNGVGTLDLQAPSAPTLTTVDRGGPLAGLTCPSASTCVAVDNAGGVLAFDPGAPEGATRAPSPVTPWAMACAAATQCTMAESNGSVTTFDPHAPGAPGSTAVDHGHYPSALACPSTTRCTLLDLDGGQSTFDPQAPSASRRVLQAGGVFPSLVCPSTSRCVAGGTSGQVVAFDPGADAPAPVTVDPGYALMSLSCPSATQCTAIDSQGARVTFNPSSPGATVRVMPPVADADHTPVAIACPSATDCVAATSGNAILEGNPQSTDAWTLHPIAGGNGMLGIACPTTELCVAADRHGNVTVGTLTPVAVDTPPAAGGGSTPPTPPAPAGPTPVAPAPAAAVSDATIKQALQKILAPAAKKAKVKTVRASGYPFAWAAPTAGTLSLRWTAISKGKVVLVGSATVKATKAATKSTKLKLKLTAAGKKLLEHGKLRISARATYTMTGRKSVVAIKAFTLK